jgi:hypothetical protein
LLEIRVEAGCQSTADVHEIYAEIRAQMDRLPHAQSAVVVSDWRQCLVMAEDAAAHLVANMHSVNTRFERVGALLPVSSSVAMLQFSRMLREGNNARRRGFKSPEVLTDWLAEVLTEPEVARLRSFLGC